MIGTAGRHGVGGGTPELYKPLAKLSGLKEIDRTKQPEILLRGK